ncbi:PREDICTED: putative nuclease HARBI1, partial [Trachymyrmex cornetzi]|uniref:putative nuclease HARBI1 n=1 Tax=Trachymyrmex cornetzi TaxID=471704 RepID=UPI00084F4833
HGDAANKQVKLQICMIAIEILNESSDSSSEEDELLELTNSTIYRPRVRNYIDVVHQYSDMEFKAHFRMSREVFNYLLNIISPRLKRKSKRYGRQTISPELQLLISIWTMATPDSYRSVCDRFDVGRATAWRSVKKVCSALNALASQFIKWPNREEAEHTWTNIKTKHKFPKIIGAIDGTHIRITKPKEHDESYINRKGYYSIQLQIICDSTLKFIHCYAGQPGSVHDMRVFRLSGFQEMCTENYFPEDSYILGDAAYAIQKHVMVPYKNNGHLTEQQINFNSCLSVVRVMVERSIALLKGRFRSLLDKLHMKRTDLIAKYIIACCVLHNICILHRDLMDDLIVVLEENQNQINRDELNVQNNEDRQEGIEKRIAITYALKNGQI